MARFAHITDLHLRPPGVLTLGMVDADRFVSEAINAVVTRHSDVDAVIVTGDVADLGEVEAYNRAAMLLSRFAMPVIVVPGNHDATEPFRDAFSAFPGIADAPVPGKVCHTQSIAGITVVALDTSLDRIRVPDHSGGLGEEQLAWLDATLSAAREPVLIAMHHPPFRTGIGFMDDIGLADAAQFARIVAKHDNVVRIVCGHVHRTIVGEVGAVPTMAVPGVAHQVILALSAETPAALVMEPPAYAIHIVEHGVAVSHVGYVAAFGEAADIAEQKAQAEPAR